jgi:hypothetical protein
VALFLKFIKSFPRQVFWFSIVSMFMPYTAIMIIAGVLLSQDGALQLFPDVLVFIAISVITAGIWWVLHMRQQANTPPSENDFLTMLKRTNKYSLLAFESEYCALCLTTGNRVNELESFDPEHLNVYRLSVTQEPGGTLFRRFEGRMTPTYILLDPGGHVMEEWALALPIQRVKYRLTTETREQKAVAV